MLGWFNTKEVDACVDSLVAELVDRVPVIGVASGKKALEKATRDFSLTFRRVDDFARGHKLNVYKKAHFVNRVRWSLREAGYPADFIETMVQEMLVHLTPPKGKKA